MFGEVVYNQKLDEKVPSGSQTSKQPTEDPIAAYSLIKSQRKACMQNTPTLFWHSLDDKPKQENPELQFSQHTAPLDNI